MVRNRIGGFSQKGDEWYEVNASTQSQVLIALMKDHLQRHILPYFQSIQSVEDLLAEIDKKATTTSVFAKMIILTKTGRPEQGRVVMNSLLTSTRNVEFKAQVLEIAKELEIVSG